MTDIGRTPDAGDTGAAGADDWPQLASAVHELSRVLRSVGERAAGLDAITGSEVEVLRCVSTRPGSTVSTVARTLGLQSSNVSTTVRSLIGRDLLERRPDPEDGRRALLHPTARARRHRALLDTAWSQCLEQALAELPEGDADAVRAAVPALTRLAGALDARRDHGTLPPG